MGQVKLDCKYILQQVFWICALGVIVFLSCRAFVDPQITPKWIAFISLGLVVLMRFAICVILRPNDLRVFPDMRIVQNSISVVLLALSIYGILQHLGVLRSDAVFKVVGRYDNPAGFAATLCVGLPFIMYGTLSKNRFVRYLNLAVFALASVAVLLSHSRAGLVTMLVVWIIGGHRFITKRVVMKWLFVVIWCSILLAIMYVKLDSASGRMLIWNCTWEMISDRLIAGYGLGGFEANYMDWQAAFFQQHPDSKYVMLADDVQYPFNEYLYVMSMFGVVGLLVVFGWIGFMVWRYWRNRSEERRAAILSIVAVCVFALFSYPSMYPFIWFALIYSSAVLLSDLSSLEKRSLGYRSVLAAVLVVTSIFVSIRLYGYVKSETNWCATVMGFEKDEALLDKYEELYDRMSGNRYFMYNYAYVLYQQQHFDDARIIASECRDLWADYDLEILQGMIELKDENYSLAKKHFKYAGYMCPNRFRPLFLLLKIYELQGEDEMIYSMAEQIVHKERKVSSTEVSRIIRYANNVLDKYNNGR